MTRLVSCARHLKKMQVACCLHFHDRDSRDEPPLDYGAVAFESCRRSFAPLRRFAPAFRWASGSIDRQPFAISFQASLQCGGCKKLPAFSRPQMRLFEVALQVGICSVISNFVLEHVDQLNVDLKAPRSSAIWIKAAALVPLFAVNFARSLKTLAKFSFVGNILMLATLVYVVQAGRRLEGDAGRGKPILVSSQTAAADRRFAMGRVLRSPANCELLNSLHIRRLARPTARLAA